MREEYETKLQDALRAMREEGEEQLRQVREEVEYLYERKVGYGRIQNLSWLMLNSGELVKS